ncbi:MAG: hypothetical protein HXY22_00795 [Alphaproteobacteria bacterium]|nr:hypothetical protein [Alphaproteobacteria bacterium]
MHMTKGAIALAALLALAVPSRAAESQAEIEAGFARTVLSKTEGGWTWFDIGNHGDLVHKPSGLACRQNLSDSERVVIKVLDPKEGQDFYCEYVFQQLGRFTVFATKMPAGMTQDDLFPLVQLSLREELPDPKPAPSPQAIAVTDDSLGLAVTPLTAAYQTTFQGRYFYSGVWLGVVDGWAIKVHASYITPEQARGEKLAQELFDIAVRTVKAAPQS